MSDDHEEGPKRTGKPVEEVELTGQLIPAADELTPVLLRVPGSDLLYLPTFADEIEMQTVLDRAGVRFNGCKQIDDGRAFLEGLPRDVVVITKLYWTDEGKIRFTQVFRGN